MKTTEEKLSVLSSIAKKFNEAGLIWAVGASTMLYFNGIAESFNDLDISVDDGNALQARDILSTMGTMHGSNPGAQYKTKHFFEFIVNGVEIDIMGGFTIIKNGVEYDCSLIKSDITGSTQVYGQSVPLQSVRVWRRYYELMGRDEKSALIDRFPEICSKA